MRNPCVSLLACLLCSVAAPTGAMAAKWLGGVSTGIQVSSFRETGLYQGPESRLSGSAALRGKYEWERVSLVGEVGYAEYGAQEPISDDPEEWPAVEWRLRYLDVPLLLKVPLPRPGSMWPRSGASGAYVMVGPSIGISLGGHIRQQLTDAKQKLEGLRAVDARVTGAIGVAFSRGNGAAGLEVRYSEALTRTFEDERMRNSAWSLLLFLLR